jgi:hypothetical protein
VLDRPRIAERITRDQAARLSPAIAHGAALVEDPEPTAGPTLDPEDDYLVALARAAGMRLLVIRARASPRDRGSGPADPDAAEARQAHLPSRSMTRAASKPDLS